MNGVNIIRNLQRMHSNPSYIQHITKTTTLILYTCYTKVGVSNIYSFVESSVAHAPNAFGAGATLVCLWRDDSDFFVSCSLRSILGVDIPARPAVQTTASSRDFGFSKYSVWPTIQVRGFVHLRTHGGVPSV